jgi:hypothetical protein
MCNAKSSLVRFEMKNIFSCFEKGSSPLQRWRCSCKFPSRRIGSSINTEPNKTQPEWLPKNRKDAKNEIIIFGCA